MRAREWLYEVKDPKVAAMQRAMRKAGALNVDGPKTGQPLTIDGVEGPNTRYNMDRPEFAGIVRQYKNPSAPHARNAVADADSLAPGEEMVPPSKAADSSAISRIQTGIGAQAAVRQADAAGEPITVGPDEPTPQQQAMQALSQATGIAGQAAASVASARPTPPHTATPASALEPEVAVPTSIDPIVRKRQGLPPATTAEIDAYAKAHPAVVGGVVGSDGKPIISGAAAEIERDARKAAKDLEAKNAKDLETKQGPNPNIDQNTRDKASMASNETGGNFDITFGDHLDPKTKTIKNGQYKTVAQWSQETLGTPLQLTQLTLDQVRAFQKYKNSIKDNSGAVGAFQFMPTTLFGSIKNGKLAPGLIQQNNIPMTAKFDQQLQQQLQDKFMAANDAILKKNGVDVNSGNRYMAHYIGPSGAVAVYKDIQTNPDITIAQSLVKHGYRDPTTNNPELAILTVGQFPEIMAKRMAGNVGYGRPTAQQFAALKQRLNIATA